MARAKMTWPMGIILLLLVLFLWLGLIQPTPAQGEARLESRINRLESELGRVRSQLSQVQSQLSLPNRPAPSLPQISPPPSLDNPSLEEQFDNLAILTIELRQQVRQLENRVAQLESGA